MAANRSLHTCKMYKLRQYTRRKTRPYYTAVVAIALFLGCGLFIIELALPDPEAEFSHSISKRSAGSPNTTNSTTTTKPDALTTIPYLDNYPKDLFTLKQWRQGAAILHAAGMIYMFIALAIVCDEFFVPALDVIIEKLELTEDVAGATFMAAGGSAPEFFTSIAGLFISQNSVGISTIIGSAVFNILFVIGACGLVAKEVLHLTWWPLFRDSIFYSIALIVLIISYLDERIHYYEALALLSCYAAYIVFMVFNQKIELFVRGRLCSSQAPNSNVDLVPVSSNASLMFIKNGGDKLNVCFKDESRTRPASSLKFRAGLLQLMIQTIDPLGEGNIEERASRLRTLATNNHKVPEETANGKACTEKGELTPVDQNGNCAEKNGTVKRNGSARVHSAIGSANSNQSSMTAVESIEDETSMQQPNNHNSVGTPIKKDTTAATNGTEVHVRTTDTQSQQSAWESPTAEQDDDDDDENAPLDISWPKTHRKRISYILLAPIIFPLWITLPDTRRPEKRRWYPLTFIGSIIWIAAFAILMVWWASVVCVAIGMPVEIIGLTVLAAGTSVPDLLTSVIVARKGFGDMAISSSIGSNLFDITIGLPLPWFLGCLMAIPNPYVEVDAKGLLCSIILLFCMLIAVIGTVACFRWRLNKPLGVTYMVLYFGFVTCSILLAYGIIPCIDVSLVTA